MQFKGIIRPYRYDAPIALSMHTRASNFLLFQFFIFLRSFIFLASSSQTFVTYLFYFYKNIILRKQQQKKRSKHTKKNCNCGCKFLICLLFICRLPLFLLSYEFFKYMHRSKDGESQKQQQIVNNVRHLLDTDW